MNRCKFKFEVSDVWYQGESCFHTQKFVSAKVMLIARKHASSHVTTGEIFQSYILCPVEPLQNGACVLDFGPQFLPRRADDSCPVVSFVSPCTLPRTERIMFMKYMLFALKMHSNRSFQFFSSGATCLTTSGIFETVHSTILPFALQEQ